MADSGANIVADAIAKHKNELFRKINHDTRQSILKLTPKECLTFILELKGNKVRKYKPEASEEYAGAMIAFCRGKQYRGYNVESEVTGVVIKTVETSILDFYGSEGICKSVSDAIIEEIFKYGAGTSIIKHEILEKKNWIGREISVMTHDTTAYSIAGTVIDAATQQIGDFFQSTVGKQVVLAISKMLATTSGKIAVMNAVKVAVMKVMASAALQTVLVNFIRKVGVGILIKTAIGKALIALLAVIGIAHVPLVWIILPLIAVLLVYEYNTFPSKLADKIPSEVSNIIKGQFDEMNKVMSESIFSAITEKMTDELTKVRFS